MNWTHSFGLALTALAFSACADPTARAQAPAHASDSASPALMRVYKSPSCGCCGLWVDHVRAQGFQVEVHDQEDMQSIKHRHGVPAELRSCHTAVVDGYVIEGHVPASDIQRLLQERHQATGLAVPGMPIGSPGMEMGSRQDPYAVMQFSASSEPTVFSKHGEQNP